MRTIALAALVCGFLFQSAFAAVSPDPVRSLHDLPMHWEGMGGDLFSKTTATLDIEQVHRVTRSERGDSVSAVYEVSASLRLGGREVELSQLELRSYGFAQNTYEMLIRTKDELVLAIMASLKYDEASHMFTLAELPRQGERRFVLTAPARK